MAIDRRMFLGGATVALASGEALAATIDASGASPGQRQALTAIAAYLEQHRAWFGLPAMGMVIIDGGQTFHIRSGARDYLQRTPLADDDLWQIGSISKSFVALVCLQLAQEGKLDLEADLRTILPEAPLVAGMFSIRGLLDHTTGLADGSPPFPIDGSKLTRGFAAGTHWSYSNTAYELIGRAIERIEGKPLATVIGARIMAPLGMARSSGGIFWRDRDRYPASYTLARPDRPPHLRPALAPAPWGEVTFGAGCVAATMADMARYLRFVAATGQGKGAPLLTDAMAVGWLAKPAPESAAPGEDGYGLGLMHRKDDGRMLLHHTGGMVCFSSSFHVDAAAGTGAFASTALGYNMNYRPRLLTKFATHAMRRVRAGQPIGDPPPLAPPPLAKPGDYAGRYAGPAGAFTIEAGPVLTLVDGTTRTQLEMLAPDLFIAATPRFADYVIGFTRDKDMVIAADWGSTRFGRDGRSAALPATPPRIAARAGRYQSDNPWIGGTELVARGDKLYGDGVQELTEIGDDVWRISDDDWNPERLRFGGFVGGRPTLAILSGAAMERRDG